MIAINKKACYNFVVKKFKLFVIKRKRETLYKEKINASMQEFGMEFFQQRIPAGGIGAHAHIHDSIELIYITQGSFKVWVNDAEYHVQKGDVCLFRSNAIHIICADSMPENNYYVLKVQPSMFFEIASEKNAVEYVLRFTVNGMEEKVHWKAQELCGSEIEDSLTRLTVQWKKEELCRDIVLKLCAYQVILALLRSILSDKKITEKSDSASADATAQIYKVIRYIHKNYGENLDARKCCMYVNMSYSYFSRCFKKIIGKNFKEYLNEVRINHAQKLLMTTDLSVTEIAAECGYNNVSYFITMYKSMKGRTPLYNRKKMI